MVVRFKKPFDVRCRCGTQWLCRGGLFGRAIIVLGNHRPIHGSTRDRGKPYRMGPPR